MGCQGSGQERETGGMPQPEAFRLGTCMKVQGGWRGEGMVKEERWAYWRERRDHVKLKLVNCNVSWLPSTRAFKGVFMWSKTKSNSPACKAPVWGFTRTNRLYLMRISELSTTISPNSAETNIKVQMGFSKFKPQMQTIKKLSQRQQINYSPSRFICGFSWLVAHGM